MRWLPRCENIGKSTLHESMSPGFLKVGLARTSSLPSIQSYLRPRFRSCGHR